MGDEAQRRDVLLTRCSGQNGVDVAQLVHVGVLQPQTGQLVGQIPAQLLLVGGGGDGVGRLAGGGVKGDVFQKTFGHLHGGSSCIRHPAGYRYSLPCIVSQFRENTKLFSPPGEIFCGGGDFCLSNGGGCAILVTVCGRGGIGRLDGFRFHCHTACGFESRRPHQKPAGATGPAGFLCSGQGSGRFLS